MLLTTRPVRGTQRAHPDPTPTACPSVDAQGYLVTARAFSHKVDHGHSQKTAIFRDIRECLWIQPFRKLL
jgi:hypothetical protein